MNIKTISDMVYADTSNRERMEKMNEVYYEMADWIKNHDANAYETFVDKAEDVVYDIDSSKAQGIVAMMTPYGQRWNWDEIRTFVMDRGVPEYDVCKYYLVMNMCYNDYRRTAEKYGLDRPDFYYDLAWDFINDDDAKSHKIAKYLMA